MDVVSSMGNTDSAIRFVDGVRQLNVNAGMIAPAIRGTTQKELKILHLKTNELLRQLVLSYSDRIFLVNTDDIDDENNIPRRI